MNWLALLRLLRAGALFSPAADVVAGFSLAGGTWGIDTVRAALASAALYGAGMILNDVFDLEEDRRHRPERPLPSGQFRVRDAAWIGALLLSVGVLIAPPETRALHAVLAGLVLGYDTFLKRTTLGAVLTMGTLRGLNLAVGGLLVVGSIDRLDDLPLTSFVAVGCYGLMIATITLLGRLEDQRRVVARTVTSLLAVPPLAGLVALTTTPNGDWAAGIGLVPVVLFGRWCGRQGRDWPSGKIRAGVGLLLLGCMLYDALLCIGANRPLEAGCILIALVLARRISAKISWT